MTANPQQPQRLYEVRYPDGDTVRMYAFMVYIADNSISLRKGPGDSHGNTIFAAALDSGITITAVDSLANPPVRVIDAPGLEDFEGRLIVDVRTPSGQALSVVAFDQDGREHTDIVPSSCVAWL